MVNKNCRRSLVLDVHRITNVYYVTDIVKVTDHSRVVNYYCKVLCTPPTLVAAMVSPSLSQQEVFNIGTVFQLYCKVLIRMTLGLLPTKKNSLGKNIQDKICIDFGRCLEEVIMFK